MKPFQVRSACITRSRRIVHANGRVFLTFLSAKEFAIFFL